MGEPVNEHLNAPLGVLLDLVERGKLEVTQLSIGTITTGYLAQIDRLKERGVEELSDFIQLGARLVFIKSQALLPTEPEQTSEIAKLNLELADYRITRRTAEALASLPEFRTFERVVTSHSALTVAEAAALPVSPADPAILGQALQGLTKRRRTTWPAAVVSTPKLSLQQAMKTILEQITAQPINLTELMVRATSRAEAVVWILACLELVKAGSISYSPTGPNNYRFEAIRG